MTPTDPELVQRLRSFVEWRDAHSISGPYQDLLTESLAALDAARQREEALQHDEAELRQHFDAFGEGQEASLQGQSRASNPYPPGDSYGVGTNWCMWDDGYDCNINRQLKAQLTAAEARVQQLEAALQERCAVWLANADDSDSGLKATIYRECADEIDALVGRADTPESGQEA